MLNYQSKNKEEPTIKDFLIYLVKKGIISKEVVGICHRCKRDAVKKGKKITVKQILLDQAYITDEAEYQRLWQDMKEDFRIHNKIAGNKPPHDNSFTLSESTLQELITVEQIDRKRYSDVPTDIILTIFNRWKEKDSSSTNIRKPNKLGTYIPPLQKVTQQIHETSTYYVNSMWKYKKIILGILLSLFIVLLIVISLAAPSPKIYGIQKFQFQIPPKSDHKNRILKGEQEKITLKQLYKNTIKK